MAARHNEACLLEPEPVELLGRGVDAVEMPAEGGAPLCLQRSVLKGLFLVGIGQDIEELMARFGCASGAMVMGRVTPYGAKSPSAANNRKLCAIGHN